MKNIHQTVSLVVLSLSLFLGGCLADSPTSNDDIEPILPIDTSNETDANPNPELESANNKKENNETGTGEIQEEKPLDYQQWANLIMYGQKQPPYGVPEDGLLYHLWEVINSGNSTLNRPADFFSEEAWESNSLQYLIENAQIHGWEAIPFLGEPKIWREDLIRGFIVLDLFSDESQGAKAAVLFFEITELDGSWLFTHFGRLEVLETLNPEDGFPFPEDHSGPEEDIIIIID